MVPVLVTISFSHYCEKGRWALEHAGVRYRERAYVPGTHLLGTVPRGGRSTPLLQLEDRVVTDSRAIVRHADAERPGSLIPSDPAQRREVERLEALFDDELGPHVRRLAYDAVLRSGTPFAPFIRATTNGLHRAIAPVLGVFVPGLVKRSLRIDEAGVARSRPRVEAVLTEVESLLADGRRHLVGDAFTAADLTFAALYSPLLGPPEHPVMSKVAPPELLASLYDEHRARPAGVFAMRLYAEERGARRGTSGVEQ